MRSSLRRRIALSIEAPLQAYDGGRVSWGGQGELDGAVSRDDVARERVQIERIAVGGFEVLGPIAQHREAAMRAGADDHGVAATGWQPFDGMQGGVDHALEIGRAHV